MALCFRLLCRRASDLEPTCEASTESQEGREESSLTLYKVARAHCHHRCLADIAERMEGQRPSVVFLDPDLHLLQQFSCGFPPRTLEPFLQNHRNIHRRNKHIVHELDI